MRMNLDMIAESFSAFEIKRDLKGHEPLLSLERWRMYDGEAELEPSVLYLAGAEQIIGTVTGTAESAIVIHGSPDRIKGKIKCPFILTDEEKISMIQLINAVTKSFSFYEQTERKMAEALYNGENFQTFVDIFSPVMSNELILMNSDFKLVGQTHETNRLYERNHFVQDMGKERIPSEVLTFFKNDPIYAKVRDEKEPFLYLASIHNVDIWCMNVFLEDQFMCRVTMPESERPFRPYDKELLRFFTGFIQKKYNDLRAKGSYRLNSSLSGLMLSLLEGKNVDEQQLDQALGLYRIGPGQLYQCMFVQPSERDYFNKTLTAYCEYLEIHYPGAVACEYENSIVCVFLIANDPEERERFRIGLVEFLRDNFLKAGFSAHFKKFRDLSVFFHQARAALETGLRHSPYKWVFTFSEECLEYMKQMVTAELPPEHLCSPKLLRLREHDELHGTEYVNTLSVYLKNGRNAVETAKDLFLHRSTMMYRLKRIREIGEINFEDPDELLYLMISIRLLG